MPSAPTVSGRGTWAPTGRLRGAREECSPNRCGRDERSGSSAKGPGPVRSFRCIGGCHGQTRACFGRWRCYRYRLGDGPDRRAGRARHRPGRGRRDHRDIGRLGGRHGPGLRAGARGAVPGPARAAGSRAGRPDRLGLHRQAAVGRAYQPGPEAGPGADRQVGAGRAHHARGRPAEGLRGPAACQRLALPRPESDRGGRADRPVRGV